MPFNVGVPSAISVFLAEDFRTQVIIAFSALLTFVFLEAIRRRGDSVESSESRGLPLFHDISAVGTYTSNYAAGVCEAFLRDETFVGIMPLDSDGRRRPSCFKICGLKEVQENREPCWGLPDVFLATKIEGSHEVSLYLNKEECVEVGQK